MDMLRIASTTPKKTTDTLVQQVEELSGESIFSCYQCGTCTSGCPLVNAMDISPHKVLRYLMFGKDEVLQSKSIWICVSCFMCAERCPRDIDIARVMEALRQITLRRNIDHVRLSHIPVQELDGMPQIALVSHLRKNTA